MNEEETVTRAARVYAAATLHADVKVLRQVGDRYEVEVITGVGGWAAPGKTFFANASIVEFTPTEAAATVEEPAQLTESIGGEDYVTLLLARQAAWIARNGGHRLPPLLEWFIHEGDEQFVILPKNAAKRERTPRVYRSAASLREERDRVAAQLEALTAEDSTDSAITNLSPFSRSRAARNAGRRRFAKMDRDLERYTSLRARLDRLDGRIALAESRESAA